ncbi:MAG: T9SS type A sorting domain-containing protein [Candidatus Latescibacteria bacterium]|nr:T9SS type A sorting domain-containing protein [Candidatus Latescibacterota bacterium]
MMKGIPVFLTALVICSAFESLGICRETGRIAGNDVEQPELEVVLEGIPAPSPGTAVWTRSFGGNGHDAATSVQQTLDGGYVVAGWTESYGAGEADGWLIKTDANGGKQWSRTFAGKSDGLYSDRLYSVQQTSDGGYILAGTTGSVWCKDAWLIKTDGEGVKQWERHFGWINWADHAYCVQQTSDGGYIVFGQYSGGGSRDVVPGAWLIKTGANGNTEWDRIFNERNYRAYWGQQTSDGGYVLATSGGGDGWLIKTDGEGVKQWERTLGGSDSDELYSVQQTSDGGDIVVGYTKSYSASDNRDVWLIKMDAEGRTDWHYTFGGEYDDEATCVRQTSDGGYVLCGTTESYGSGGKDAWLIYCNYNPSPVPEDTFVVPPLPASFYLAQSYPNPFNPLTNIHYQLSQKRTVRLQVYNVCGQLLRTLVDGEKPAGVYTVQWDGRDDLGETVASGIYLYRMQAGSFRQTRKMALIR